MDARRPPKNLWDIFAREQQKGQVDGLLQFEAAINSLETDLISMSEGKEADEPTKPMPDVESILGDTTLENLTEEIQ